MKAPPEPLLNVQVTPNEIIAMNLAIGYFLRLCKHISPVYDQTSVLLDQYQRRLTEQLPPQPELRH